MSASIFSAATTPLRPGITLLEASAGTGKTYSLTTVAVRLLIEDAPGGDEPFVASIDRLLLVTFTRAATDELRQRLRRRIQEALHAVEMGAPSGDEWLDDLAGRTPEERARLRRRLRPALRDVDLARVQTIHSFCAEILRDGAFEAGLPVDLGEAVETRDLLSVAADDAWRHLLHEGGPAVVATLHGMKRGLRGGRMESLESELETTMNHPEARWLPELPNFEDARRALEAAIRAVDFAAMREDCRQYDGNWNKVGREEVAPALEVFTDGFEVDDVEHWSALRGLRSLATGEAVPKRGKAHERLFALGWHPSLVAALDAAQQFEQSVERYFLEWARGRFERLKRRAAVLDFSDLIRDAWRRLDAPETGERLARRIAGRIDAALVDEFQDTDALQWRIFKRLFAGESASHVLMLVGDPKQAIYGFRGADIYAYLQARDDAQETLALPKNHRSHPELVEAVNAIFGRRPDESFFIEGLRFEAVDAARSSQTPPLGLRSPAMSIVVSDEIFSSRSGYESWATRQVVREIEHLIALEREAGDEEFHPGQVAVLVESHAQSRKVMRALRRAGISAVLAQSGDIHTTEAMSEWRIVLESLLEPVDLRRRRRARLTRIWGDRASDLSGDGAPGDAELWAELRKRWLRFGFASMATLLLRERRTLVRILAEVDGDRWVTDLRHAFEVIQAAEHRDGLGPQALVRWMIRTSQSPAPQRDENRQLRLDRDESAVQIVTNFASKGLEYDVVYIPFACYARDLLRRKPFRLHLDDREHTLVLDFVGDDEALTRQAVLEGMSERARLAYVALTRARERCVLFFAQTPSKPFRGQNSGGLHSAAVHLLARPDVSGGADRRAWLARGIDALGEGGWVERMRERAAAWPTVEVREGAAGAIPEDSTVIVDAEPLRCRALPPQRRQALSTWKLVSYTSLVRRLVDVDDTPILADQVDPGDATAAATGKPTGIFAFARGARAGICLHELLERSDFDRPFEARDEERVARLLSKHGLDDPQAHRGDVDPQRVCLQLVRRVADEPVPEAGFRFGDLSRRQRLDEWKFTLPLRGFAPTRLAEVLERTWDDPRIDAVVHRVRHLESEALEGYLGGFVDLVCEHEGRWYVFDWKSNDLGPSAEHYEPDRVWRAMLEHDYPVQALFYLTALHRFLRVRQADYDYDLHMGGAGYVFLRGLDGSGIRGWSRLRPPRATIEAIDALFGGDA